MPWLDDAGILQFLNRVRPSDVLDVVLVTALIYYIIRWLRGGASRTVVIIVMVAVGLLILERVFDLYLTQLLVERLFPVFILAFIVLFRDELRRELDRLTARWRVRRQAARDKTTQMFDTVVTAVARMAREHIGAIIVITGREEWRPRVSGGVPLEGRVSEPLLYSIFHHESPGHDGAVIIEGHRINRFAAHLPLSTNLDEVGPRGTRHTAGLGITEYCDALVIIVSEERGEISVARNGRLETINTPTQLKEDLDEFRRDTQPHHGRNGKRLWSWQELGTATLSVTLAVVLWAIFAYRSDTAFRSYDVPIEFHNPPESMSIDEATPTQTRVVLGGPSQALRQLDREQLVFQLDLTDIELGENVIAIDRDAITLPSDLQCYTIEPPVVRVTTSLADPDDEDAEP